MKDFMLSVRVQSDLVEEIEKAAELAGVSRSEYLRQILGAAGKSLATAPAASQNTPTQAEG